MASLPQPRRRVYPNKDIHVIVGFPAGSGADVYARYFANKLSVLSNKRDREEQDGRAVEHRHRICGARKAGRLHAVHWWCQLVRLAGSIFKKPPTDPRKDFVYISPLVSQGFILVVTTDKPFKTVADLTADLKQKGDKASYATANDPATILAETYKKSAGLATVQVNYKTSTDFINDMMDGRIDFVMADPVFGLSRMHKGEMKPLAISTGTRIPSLPEHPRCRRPASPASTSISGGSLPRPPARRSRSSTSSMADRQIGEIDEDRFPRQNNDAEPFTASARGDQEAGRQGDRRWENFVKLAKIEAQ